MNIKTEYVFPPIPYRGSDWVAYLADEDYDPEHHLPVGWGATEQEAIEDLKTQLEAVEGEL